MPSSHPPKTSWKFQVKPYRESSGLRSLGRARGVHRPHHALSGRLPTTRHIQLAKTPKMDAAATMDNWLKSLKQAGRRHRLAGAHCSVVSAVHPRDNLGRRRKLLRCTTRYGIRREGSCTPWCGAISIACIHRPRSEVEMTAPVRNVSRADDAIKRDVRGRFPQLKGSPYPGNREALGLTRWYGYDASVGPNGRDCEAFSDVGLLFNRKVYSTTSLDGMGDSWGQHARRAVFAAQVRVREDGLAGSSALYADTLHMKYRLYISPSCERTLTGSGSK